MSDLRTERFVLFSDPDSAVNDAVLRSARGADFIPIREHEAAGISVLLPLVAADLGVALVPGSARAAPLAGVVFRDVTDAASVDLALVWRADEANPAVLAVLDALSAGSSTGSRRDSPAHLPEPDEAAR
jgi:DNA-binding transcriptional LysR family regulator